ncbi:MAG: 2,4-dihydroxyhept-2-ene-1,7-dioic acid aldolase [Candidatus Omnitrophica bacterium]|nr:2,4-dihydroxyhept-2-ene-1,7-dioic acid aldolase [Candidatus Omnitrophota bacterium]
MKSLKKRINGGELTIGSWITISSPENVEVMGQFGFDWLTVDMEHSMITLPQAQQLVRTIKSMNIPALVRVEENNANNIKRVMDLGADGIIVPMVLSKEGAQRAVEAVKYPPQGIRGVGLTRAQGYGFKFDSYKEWVKRESIVIAIIEHYKAVDHLEEILSVDGIDATMIGPYDLSGSMGYPGEYKRKNVADQIARYLKVSKALNKPAGFHVVPPVAKQVDEKIRRGFKFLAFGTDALFLGTKIKEQLRMVKKLK